MAIVATEESATELRGASPVCAIPQGQAHALDPGASHTRCGLDATWLMAWPELAWPPSGMAGGHTCPACEAAARG